MPEISIPQEQSSFQNSPTQAAADSMEQAENHLVNKATSKADQCGRNEVQETPQQIRQMICQVKAYQQKRQERQKIKEKLEPEAFPSPQPTYADTGHNPTPREREQLLQQSKPLLSDSYPSQPELYSNSMADHIKQKMETDTSFPASQLTHSNTGRSPTHREREQLLQQRKPLSSDSYPSQPELYSGSMSDRIKQKPGIPELTPDIQPAASKVSTRLYSKSPETAAKDFTMRRLHRQQLQPPSPPSHIGTPTIESAQSIKGAARSIKSAPHAVKGAKRTVKTAEKAAAKASVRSTKAAKDTAKATAKTVKAAVKAVVSVVKASFAAIKGLAGIIIAGGWVAVVVILIIAALVFLLASPFGIFTGGDSGGSTPRTAAVVQELRNDLESRIAEIQENTEYDYLQRNGDVDWIGLLSVYAVKCAYQSGSMSGILVWNDTAIHNLKAVYQDMVSVEHTKDSSDETTTLYLSVTCKSPFLMPEEYRFNTEQTAMLSELLSPAYSMTWADVLGLPRPDRPGGSVTLPDGLDIDRRTVVESALTLEGRVGYFWGGKSTVIGWDDAWGTMRKVTAPGNSTTGTLRPYGMDCSGFTAWAFINGAGSKSAGDTLGYNTSDQWSRSTAIPWTDAQPGDLLFLTPPGQEQYNHVGIVLEKDGDDYLVIHCTAGRNNVVVTSARAVGFRYARRPASFSAQR